ncbi:MAG: DUF1538 domain-containing protein [Clostridiales bacterium]|nr:DUF1538 domain-containing protein [Clostridiales bacterium]
MNQKLKEKIQESIASVLPITAIVLLLATFIVPISASTITLFLAGALLLVIGMGMFQLGAEMAMSPLGERMGEQLSKTSKLLIILLISFILGVVATIAEPDLQVLANQVPSIPNSVLIITVSIGVGLMLAVAMARILFHISLSSILLFLYLFLMIVSILAPGSFLSVAFDAGGVTTGPITVPFIMAIGIGLSSIRGDKNAGDDSFGLVSICSTGPILAVVILGIFYHPDHAFYTPTEIPDIETMHDVAKELSHTLPQYLVEVLVSLLPILAVFFVFQLLAHSYNKRQLIRMSVGFLYTYLGLALFLCGVNVGFAPVGSLLGAGMASSRFKWFLIPTGMLIGYFIVKAEPAVHVLNRQVEEVTGGTITATAMNRCLSIGISVSVGLAIVRVLTGLSLYWVILPGYIIALILSRIVPPIFVGIAFDAGGVASGPMTTTFLLPLAMGACETLGGNVMSDAFGIVALVAMTPLIAVQLMGLVYKTKQSRRADPFTSGEQEKDEIIIDEEEQEKQMTTLRTDVLMTEGEVKND